VEVPNAKKKKKKSENMIVCVDLLFNSQFQSKHRKRLLKIRMEIVPENQWSWIEHFSLGLCGETEGGCVEV